MHIKIPNYGEFDIQHIIIDYNGTIAVDGKPLEILEQLQLLSEYLNVYILTGDTYGDVTKQLADASLQLKIAATKADKEAFIIELGPTTCIAIGNGNIDALMLKRAAIGIAVLGPEGCSSQAIINADMLVTSIEDAISLITNKNRLIAGLKE